ncbi:MAG: nicotinate phosphoribosyltransferase [Nanoarchaeota archaeon]|nr:nicotinate phosphoribosyltransferase [Nanoarchaeota archaeon]
MAKTNIIDGYEQYTDKYFLRSKQILETEKVNPIVRYQVFARQDIPELTGVDEAISFVKDIASDKIKIYALRDGQEYNAKEPFMKLEGRAQDLIDLETVYLSITSGRFTGKLDFNEIRKNSRAIVNAANGKPCYDFSARHFAPEYIGKIAKICQEEGFVGCSTDIGAGAWNAKGIGTIPHALILIYTAYMKENGIRGNPTVEAAKAFDRNIGEKVPRIILVDTFNREIDDTIATAKTISNLVGARIDTCGENYAQDSKNIQLPDLNVNPKYLRGKGVTIAGNWALRRALDENGLGNLEITVSSGFNAEKTAAFVEADKVYQELYGKPLFDSIGTGSFTKPIMTTSDIVAYFSEKQNQWLSLSKKGRDEKSSKRLEEIKW